MKLFISLIFIAAATCATIFFTVPQYVCSKDSCGYNGIRTVQKEEIAYTQALTSAQNLEARRATLTDKYNAVSRDDRDRLEQLLPNNVDNIKLVLELETLAKKYGLIIESPKLQTNVDNKPAGQETNETPGSLPYGTFTLDFTVRAKYENIKLLMNDIEHNLRLIELAGITIKVPGDDYSTTSNKKSYPEGTYDVNIRAVIFYLKN